MYTKAFLHSTKELSWIRRILVFLLFLFSLFALSSCASASEEYNTQEGTYVCNYSSSNNTTIVTFHTTIENNSILDIKNVSYSFNLYNNDTLIKKTELLSFEAKIEHGKTTSFDRAFSFNGNINKILRSEEKVEFKNLWETYMPWFIVTIVIVGLFALVYTIIAFANALEIGDFFTLIGENWWLVFIFFVPYIHYFIDALSSNVWSWVPPLIILGGIFAIIIVILVVHLIAFIIEKIRYGDGYSYYPKYQRDTSFDNDSEQIEDYLDNKEALYQFTLPQLKDYCRSNGIKGYSSLSKDQIINLIMNGDNNSAKDEKTTAVSKKSVSKKGITFEDIAGLDEAKEVFREKVILPFEHPEIYEKFGKKVGGGILLYGLPGTGKTMFAEAASNEVNAAFIPIKCSDIKSKWYGESEQKIKSIFSRARRSKKAIIFFDEFEAIGAKRTDDSDNPINGVVPQILAEMQGVGSSKTESTIVVIAATNKPWSIDSAFMRPGRFDEKIYIPLPDEKARKVLFENQLKDLPVAEDLDYDYLVKITEGFNGADIKEVCEKLKMSAIKDSLEKGEEQTIGMDDVKRIEDSIRSSVSTEDVRMLKDFEEL